MSSLPLFDSGEVDGLLFYVMPFVDGESLRARLDREKQLPIDEATRIAVAVAAALDYAHRHGVIHRDLKPENILLQDGQPLIADFGIALAVSNAGGARVTQTGLSLGTPQYMSPEQATGDRSIDARTDIYSLGAVTYEMFAGEPPHSGTTAQAIIARLMTEDPRPLTAVRRNVPAYIDAAVGCALEKLPADRFATAKEFSDALQGRAQSPVARAGLAAEKRARANLILPWAVAGVAVAVAALLGATVWSAARAPVPTPVRFRIEPPAGLRIGNYSSGLQLAISPDGQVVAFTAGQDNKLFVRRLKDLDAVAVGGVDRVSDIRFSGDGRVIGYKGAGTFSKIPVSGAAKPTTVLEQNVWHGMGWTYSADMIYALNDTIWRITKEGVARPIANADPRSEAHWNSPYPMPDGRTLAVRVVTRGPSTAQPAHRLGLLSIDGGAATIVDIDFENVVGYLDGVLVYGSRPGRVMAVRLDLAKRRASGEPVAMVDDAAYKGTGGVMAVLSENGTLAYVGNSNASRADVIDERGTVSFSLPEGHVYSGPLWSPDGRRIAVTVTDERDLDIWVYDVGTRVLSRLTQTKTARASSWTPDGTRIAFISEGRAHWVASDGSSLPVQIPGTSALGARQHTSVGFSPDGKYAIVRYPPPRTGGTPREAQAVAVPLAGGAPVPMLESTNTTLSIRLSPDSRWVAYVTRESGEDQVYVTRFLTEGGRVQISATGGTSPQWARDGRHLYFRDRDTLRVATLDVTGALPRVLAVAPAFAGYAGLITGPFDLQPEGKGVVTVRQMGEGARIAVVTNWFSEVRGSLANSERAH